MVIDALRLGGAELLGISDPALPAGSSGPLEVPVLGGDEVLQQFDPSAVLLANGLGSVGVPNARHELFVRFKRIGYSFQTVVHPSATVAADARIGEGAQIMAGAVLQTGSVVGENAIVNTRASVDHHCHLGQSVHIAPGAVLSGCVTIGPLQ